MDRVLPAAKGTRNHGRLRAVRKDIARIYTVLTERALGQQAEQLDRLPALRDALPQLTAGYLEGNSSEFDPFPTTND